jgi:hypothetical protein
MRIGQKTPAFHGRKCLWQPDYLKNTFLLTLFGQVGTMARPRRQRGSTCRDLPWSLSKGPVLSLSKDLP